MLWLAMKEHRQDRLRAKPSHDLLIHHAAKKYSRPSGVSQSPLWAMPGNARRINRFDKVQIRMPDRATAEACTSRFAKARSFDLRAFDGNDSVRFRIRTTRRVASLAGEAACTPSFSNSALAPCRGRHDASSRRVFLARFQPAYPFSHFATRYNWPPASAPPDRVSASSFFLQYTSGFA